MRLTGKGLEGMCWCDRNALNLVLGETFMDV